MMLLITELSVGKTDPNALRVYEGHRMVIIIIIILYYGKKKEQHRQRLRNVQKPAQTFQSC